MNKLDEILSVKRREVEQRKKLITVQQLEKSVFFQRSPISFTGRFNQLSTPGIIAEFKRKSPSKGVINQTADVVKVAGAYLDAGAVGVSILTDIQYFGGTFNDIISVRQAIDCAVLRKDFIVDEYQIIESKSVGADMILLIAACLSSDEAGRYYMLAHSLGLEVLFEVHNEEELQKCGKNADLIGVNNRNLKTFKVDTEISYRLIEKIPVDKIAVSESGLSRPDEISKLYAAGYKGFLIGGYFMQFDDPGKACFEFISQIQKV